MFVRTSRLLLRPGWADDAPALARAIGEEAIVRNLATVPWPYSADDARGFLIQDTPPLLPRLLVFARTQGVPRLVGGCGLSTTPEGNGVQLGYWIARPHWGLGYATEAAQAMLDLAQAIGIHDLTASHFVDNPASARVLRKLGFHPTGRIVQRHSVARGTEAPAALYAWGKENAGRPMTRAGVRWSDPTKVRSPKPRQPSSAAA